MLDSRQNVLGLGLWLCSADSNRVWHIRVWHLTKQDRPLARPFTSMSVDHCWHDEPWSTSHVAKTAQGWFKIHRQYFGRSQWESGTYAHILYAIYGSIYIYLHGNFTENLEGIPCLRVLASLLGTTSGWVRRDLETPSDVTWDHVMSLKIVYYGWPGIPFEH